MIKVKKNIKKYFWNYVKKIEAQEKNVFLMKETCITIRDGPTF